MVRPALIPPERLVNMPRQVRLAHEYCFFVHDEAVRMLAGYEAAKADIVTTRFRNREEMEAFNAAVAGSHAIDALRAIGREEDARRVIMNRITFALVSDFLHHVYEALRCMEKRKFVVAFNLLRKPLHDNLLLLAWMLGDEDSFYEAFTRHGPRHFTTKHMGNRRLEILEAALSRTDVAPYMTASSISSAVWDSRNPHGLYGLFQHAVHLVTVERAEIETDHENFNFVFKNPNDDDVYRGLYGQLPQLLLFAAHVVRGLFDRMKPMDRGSAIALTMRSVYAWFVVLGRDPARKTVAMLNKVIAPRLDCEICGKAGRFTKHNAAGILMCEAYHCNACEHDSAFPFSWLIGELWNDNPVP